MGKDPSMIGKLLHWRGPGQPEAAAGAAAATPGVAVALVPDQDPGMSVHEAEWKHRVHARVLKLLDLQQLEHAEEQVARTQIRELAQRVMNDEAAPLSAATRQQLATRIEHEILGLGPLEPLLADHSVADILVNGYDSVYVERRGKLERTNVRFRDTEHLMRIIERIVTRVGRRIDESSPMVDARLADGSRVNAVIPPLAIDGPLVSIRRFTVGRLSMAEMIELGSISPRAAELCAAVVRGRLNVLISGGTGSGKTTLLNVMSSCVPESERILTIEDSAELKLQQPHVCRLETRTVNIEGRGEVTQRDLVRNALRMRPDRIILGEVRGGEALDMLQAMNTGHDGSLATVHANSPRDALSRIENMVAMSGVDLPLAVTRAQIASAIQVVIQVERMEDGGRRVVSIQEIQGMEGSVITMAEIYRFRRAGVDKSGRVKGQFEATGLMPRFAQRLQQRGIPVEPAWFEPGG